MNPKIQRDDFPLGYPHHDGKEATIWMSESCARKEARNKGFCPYFPRAQRKRTSEKSLQRCNMMLSWNGRS